jgi:hypothetical protein
MPMPAPFFDNGWNWSAQREAAPTRPADAVRKANSPRHVLWEIGLVLVVPLVGAGLVEMILTALHIY